VGLMRLDDLYRMVAHIYGQQNEERSLSTTFTHFVEVCGMLTIHDRPRVRNGIDVETALCKALGWYFPLMAKLKVDSVEELVFRKYPYACPYCRLVPHDDIKCKTIKGVEKTVNHEALRAKYNENKDRRPSSLDDWQRMFQAIYPRQVHDQPGRSTSGLFEELGELAEAIRVFDRHPKFFVGEAADVFSYLMGLANEHFLRAEASGEGPFSLEEAFIRQYPGLCPQCGYQVCVCPSIPDATVGRMAKELDLGKLDAFFIDSMEDFDRRAIKACEAVWDHLGGYSGLLQETATESLFDRGEANRVLVVFCLKMADLVEDEDPGVAQTLRSAAIKAGTSTTGAGTKMRSQSVAEVVETLRQAEGLRQHLGDPLVQSDPMSAHIGRVLLPAVKVLLVFSNPKELGPLRLSSEHRTIDQAIRLSKNRERVEITPLHAATIDDLRRTLLGSPFDIVHFAGHSEGGVALFEDEAGQAVPVSVGSIASLIRHRPSVRCVILNACESLADFDESIGVWTIGMEADLGNDAAIEFSKGFYDAIGAGEDIEEDIESAIAEGELAVKLRGLEESFSMKVLRPS
jgi:NTP pyrophosphatase (non-canonical NTP hydrolase)